MEYLSRERYDQIKAELENLKNVEFPKIREDVAEARSQGDLSENFGYHASKRALSKTIGRIRFLRKVLEYSKVIDPETLPKDEVTLLSRVEFTNLDTGRKMTYTIVSPHEMDFQNGKISLNSPIGKALMGKRTGEEVTVHAPAATLHLRIESVSFK